MALTQGCDRQPLQLPASSLSFILLMCLLFACTGVSAQTARYSGTQIRLPSLAESPYGITLDKNGDLFSVDNFSGVVSELSASGQVHTTASGGADVTGLSFPWGVAVDDEGNLYITEQGVEHPTDVVKETRIPSPNGNFYTRSVVPIEGFDTAGAIAVDSKGKLYITDTYNQRVIVETPVGNSYVQSTLPIGANMYPWALAVDAQGNVYISDIVSYRVVKETPSAKEYVESTVAGPLTEAPESLAVDEKGNLYIDAYTPGDNAEDFFVIEETPSPAGYRQSPVVFGPGANPWNIAVDQNGIVYGGGSRGFEKLVPGAGAFSTAAVKPPPGLNDSPEVISLLFTIETEGRLGKPAVLTQGAAGLDFQDMGQGSCTLQENGPLFHAGDTCSVNVMFKPLSSGLRMGAVVLPDATHNVLAIGYVYGTGMGAQVAFLPSTVSVLKSGLAQPSGVAVDAMGNLFVAERGSGMVYKGIRNGNGYIFSSIASGMPNPDGVAVDGAGNVFVAAADTVYQETPVGTNYVQGARFALPGQLNGIAVDGSGNLYLTAAASGDVHKESLQPDGSYLASAIGSGISGPTGIAVDDMGNIFVAEPREGKVYEEALQTNGSYRQTVLASGLAEPQGVAVDSGGSLYIAALTSGNLYKESLQPDGSRVEQILATGLAGPGGITLDQRGNAYVALDAAGKVEMIDMADAPELHFAKTAVGSISTDSPQLLTVLSMGNAPLYLSFPIVGSNPSLSSGFAFGAATTCPVEDQSTPSSAELHVDAGASCSYAVNFTPVVSGPTRGSLTLLDIAKQTVELREAGITSDTTRTAVRITPADASVGRGAFVTVTVSDTSYAPIIPQGGGVTFTDTARGKTTALNGGIAIPLVAGKAALSFVPAVAGEHNISAHYGGVNASFTSSSGEAMFNVLQSVTH